MAVRFEHTFYGTYGTEYLVEIHDEDFIGSATFFELSSEGFFLRVLQEGEEIYHPIKPTQLELPILITNDANGALIYDFLQETLIQGNEDKYTIRVYREGQLYWCGVVLPDIAAHEDTSSTYEWKITATDGINRLKNFEFDPAYMGGAGITHGVESFKSILFECLKKTPLYFSTTENLLFSTCVEWYENAMPTRTAITDPIAQTYVDTWAFTRVVDNGARRENYTLYEVLESICKAWGMRLIFSNGLYRFLQIGAYDQTSSSFERFYRRSNGAYSSNAVLSDEVKVNDSGLPVVLGGNQWSYFPPIKSVNIRFPFDNSNLLNGGISLPYTEQLPNSIVGGIGKAFLITTTISIRITDLAFSQANGANVTVRIGLNLGTSYRLEKDILTASNTWATTTGAFADFGKLTYSKGFEVPISFITEDIPSGTFSNNQFTVDVEEVVDANNGNPLTYIASRLPGTTSMVYAASSDDEGFYYYYEVQNTATTINSYDIEEPDAILGEMFFSSYFGGLYTGNTSGWNPSTAQWRIKDTGTSYNFILLRIREIMAAQITATAKYQGGIVGASNINPHTLMTYDGWSYLLNGGTYTAGSETWEGEWFKTDYNRASVEEIENETNQDGGDTNTELRRSIGEVSVQLDNFTLKGGSVLVQTLSASTTLEALTQTVLVNGGYTITLPPAADWILMGGKSVEITVKNIGGVGDTVVVDGNGAETIDGSNSVNLARYEKLTLVSNGSNIYTI